MEGDRPSPTATTSDFAGTAGGRATHFVVRVRERIMERFQQMAVKHLQEGEPSQSFHEGDL